MAETFGVLTRRWRLEASLSQNRLARLAGVDAAYVNRIERHIHIPSRTVVFALAAALHLTPRDTDRYLYIAGLAPVIDWQARCEEYETRLATIYGAIDGLTLPDAVEAHPFVRRSA